MKLGVYDAILHDRPLDEALDVVATLGLDGIEINSGGFLRPVHLPIDDILASDAARDHYLAAFEKKGLALLGLNCNGNPLHPDPAIGPKHAEDLRRSIRVAARLGQSRVVTMSGLPGGYRGDRKPNWVVNAWNSGYLDMLDHQWEVVAVPFWREIDELAGQHGVRVAIEMHPQNIVFNPTTLKRLVEMTGATNVGAEMDPSHLFWQGIDPVAAIRWLGPLVFHAAAKDTRINDDCRIHGVLDERFRRLDTSEKRVNLGGDEWVNEWPKDSAWDFVALGRGHDVEFWAGFLGALGEVDPDMAVNIEHEDTAFGPIEGLEVSAKVLREAAGR